MRFANNIQKFLAARREAKLAAEAEKREATRKRLIENGYHDCGNGMWVRMTDGMKIGLKQAIKEVIDSEYDAFSPSELSRRINKLREKERLEEIGRAANQILVAYVAANPGSKITQKEVDESLRLAAEIHDLIQLNISQYADKT